MHHAYCKKKWKYNKIPFLQTIYFNIGHDWLEVQFTGSSSQCADQYGLTSQAQGAYIHILSGTWHTWAQYWVKMQWLSEFLVAFLRKQDESRVLYHKTAHRTAQNSVLTTDMRHVAAWNTWKHDLQIWNIVVHGILFWGKTYNGWRFFTKYLVWGHFLISIAELYQVNIFLSSTL